MIVDTVATVAAINKALDHVRRISVGDQRWRMSIPAQESDSDIVITDALVRARKLILELDEGEA